MCIWVRRVHCTTKKFTMSCLWYTWLLDDQSWLHVLQNIQTFCSRCSHRRTPCSWHLRKKHRPNHSLEIRNGSVRWRQEIRKKFRGWLHVQLNSMSHSHFVASFESNNWPSCSWNSMDAWPINETISKIWTQGCYTRQLLRSHRALEGTYRPQ